MVKKRISKKIINIVQDYTKRLIQKDKIVIEQAIIFGSCAKKTTHRWSDVDVCLISPKFKNEFKALQFLWTRRNKEEVMAGLEPIGFSKKSFQEGSSLINEIKTTGIEIAI